MAFRIEYFSKGVLVGGVPCPKSLLDAKENAKRGIKLHGADFAKIVDMDDHGKVIAVVKLGA